ncbi:DUF6704 family protein [Microbacterium sp. T2.11-28]|uniref:DUF6704 family protein n=1 Tax=Microbacterium sp. T2.11-28 TaxID=3041169 RepID=UPI0024773CC9|nr:DUF6704 family protein [Microbacterium sp. T2.11-28]CAI9385879.1 hypothetical protein MICABA_00051 [Microbacterium sp. T2.11-28]
MSNSVDDPGHGHSPAAWTAVVIMLVAIALGTLFFFLEMPVLVWICVGLTIVGALTGWALARAGYGVNGSKYTSKQH